MLLETEATFVPRKQNDDAKLSIIRLMLVDSYDLIRLGVRMLLQSVPDISIVGDAASFTEAKEQAQQHLPDLILLEPLLNDGSAHDRISELHAVAPKSKILIVTSSADAELHRLCLRQGACGIVSKNQKTEILLKAIRCVHDGEMWANREQMAFLVNDLIRGVPEPVVNQLTPRELVIAKLAAKGQNAKRIALALGINDKTVRNQLVSIYNKLDVKGQLELAARAAELGLLNN